MAVVRKEEVGRTITLADRVRELEREKTLESRRRITSEKEKRFKYPWKWRFKFSQSKRKANDEKVLVIFLNKKNEIEPPRFMPIFDGNMVIWKNKPYEFDPRAIWTVKGIKKNPRAYLIKEIDRRPVRNKFNKLVYGDAAVSNLDLDAIRIRGDSTESDEFLIKAALKAQVASSKVKFNIVALVIIGLLLIGGLIWFFTSN